MNPSGHRFTAQRTGRVMRLRSRTALDQSQPKISRHLALLREAGYCWTASKVSGFITAYHRISSMGGENY